MSRQRNGSKMVNFTQEKIGLNFVLKRLIKELSKKK